MLDQALSLPPGWYVDPAQLRLEQERVFRRSWQYAGHAGQIAAPGSFFACRAGDVPIVVTRARDDELRAFVNVCRHRGHLVAEGEGQRETLQCPYHAWTYGLDGELRAAPRLDGRTDGLGLVPAAVGTWGPFVFVNPDADAPSLAEHLGELPALLGDLSALRFHSRVPFSIEANWKVSVENFLECYHCPTAHKSFSALVDTAPESYRLEEHATFSSQFCTTRDGASAGQFHLLFPNTGINCFPGSANLSIGPILPAGAERTARFLDYFFGEETTQAEIDELFALDEQVGAEDTALVESVQQGLRSGMVQGRLILGSEHLVAHFQSLLRIAIA